jgi:hypothetical protein
MQDAKHGINFDLRTGMEMKERRVNDGTLDEGTWDTWTS